MPTLKCNSPRYEKTIRVGMNVSLSLRTLNTSFNNLKQQGAKRDTPQGQRPSDQGPCQDPSFTWHVAGSLPPTNVTAPNKLNFSRTPLPLFDPNVFTYGSLLQMHFDVEQNKTQIHSNLLLPQGQFKPQNVLLIIIYFLYSLYTDKEKLVF